MRLTQQEDQICSQVEALQDQAIDMLTDLVAFDSQIGHEQAAQNYMANYFESMGLTVDRFEIDHESIKRLPGYSPSLLDYSGRENIVGVHEPAAPAEAAHSLILNGHIDIVPAGPLSRWSSDPFQARIEGDKLYGRGSGDMKAGIVAYTMAYKAIRNAGYHPAACVYLQSVIEEECTGNGALACLDRGYRADAAIIPEPFGKNLLIAQLGVMWLQIHVGGYPAHVLDTSAGVNAIEAAYDIFRELKVLETQWNQIEHRHACFLDHPHPVNFNLGKIEGGDWSSTVPTSCRMHIRIGFYPDQSLEEIKAQIEHCVQQAAAMHPHSNSIQVDVSYQGFQAEGFAADPSSDLLNQLSEVHQLICNTTIGQLASTATTDARFFHLYGKTPATCYGPDAENYHSFDEWVSISSMMDVAKVLAVFMARWCGLQNN